MKIKEFEKQLNQLATLKDLKFQVKEKVNDGIIASLDSNLLRLQKVLQGEIIVYVCVNDYKEVLLKIMPPDDEVKQWYLDNESSNCLFDVTSLPIYISILKLALRFLEDKNESKDFK
ncbi:hypothetical protein [Lactobacillus crispatus]|uniref:hypothetical protein n=1 Tax=Lactobacillus crispatus TaxID=47770 RepID=UPI0018A959AD|nr:hypothetical protein [Lactobacillus crispatus]